MAIRLPTGVFRAPARVSFFCCQKKDTKENHSDLRSKNPLARGELFVAVTFPLATTKNFRFFLGQKDCAPSSFRYRSAAAARCHGLDLSFYRFGPFSGGLYKRADRVVGPYGGKRITMSGFALLAMTSLSSEAPVFSAKTRRGTL